MATRTARHQREGVPIEPQELKKEYSYHHLIQPWHPSVLKHICSRVALYRRGCQTTLSWRQKRTIRLEHGVKIHQKEPVSAFCTDFSPPHFQLFYWPYIQLFFPPLAGDKTTRWKCCGHFSRVDKHAETHCGALASKSYLDSQSFSTLSTTCIEYTAAVFCRHTCTETVGTFTWRIMRLVCSFHKPFPLEIFSTQ
jgi:hypothetical protein